MNKRLGGQYIPDYDCSTIDSSSEIVEMPMPEEKKSIGQYGRLHKEYLRKHYPDIYSELENVSKCIKE